MTTPNPTALQFDATLAQNPSLAQDPSLAYPVVASGIGDPQQQTQVVNSSAGTYYAQYLTSLPTSEQADAWSALNAQQQQLAQSAGYTSALQQNQTQVATDPGNHAGPSFLGRIGNALKSAVSGTVGAAQTGVMSGLHALGVPLQEVQRGVNTGILDLTDLAEGHGISPLEAWNQAGNAPMTTSSMDGLVSKYGQPLMDLVRDTQLGKSPQAQMGALIAKGNADPANQAAYNSQANQIESMYTSPEFKQALIEANNHLISPGRMVTSWVANALSEVQGKGMAGTGGLYSHKALFGALSGPVDAVFDFQADPLMVGAKIFEAQKIATKGLQIAEKFGEPVAEELAPELAGAEAGAETGGVGGEVAGPEGAGIGAVVGGAAGFLGASLKNLVEFAKGASTPAIASAVSKGLTRNIDNAPISDMAGFQRRLGAVFQDTSVQRYFNGAGEHIANIVNGSDNAAQSMRSLRRNYTWIAPYLDAMTQWSPGANDAGEVLRDLAGNKIQGVQNAKLAEQFFNDTKGFQLLTQGAPASRVPLMASRTALQAGILKYMPRASQVFDWMENGHKVTQDTYSDLKQNMDSASAQLDPETRAVAAASAPDLSVEATTRAAAAQQLDLAQRGWRGRAATAMRRVGSKLPDYQKLDSGETVFDLTADNASQNFVRTARLFAPTWYADQMGAAFAAADVTGRKNLYDGLMKTMADTTGISKTEGGRQWLSTFSRAVQDSDVGKYSITNVGRGADGTPMAWDINKARPYVPAIPIKELFAQGAKHGVFAHTVGFTNKEVVDTLVDKVWRPFVLLRPAFAFRSSIEEAVNHVFRVGMTDKLKGMLSRSALNALQVQRKTTADLASTALRGKFNEFDQAVRDEHGIQYGANVPATLRKMSNESGADSEELRALALKHEEMFADAQAARTTADAMPDSFDPDHSRMLRFLLSPITGSAAATSAIMRRIPLEWEIKGHGFTTYGARLKDLVEAHEAEGMNLRATARDATADWNAAKGAEGEQAARENMLSAKAAVDNHPDLHPEVRAARDNMVQGFVDRRTANLIHFFGRVGLAYLQKSSPAELKWLQELAESPRGDEIVNHAITEMASKTMQNQSVDMGPRGKRGTYRYVSMGPFGEQNSLGNSGAHAWSWALDDMSQNPVARAAMLHADNPVKATQAVKDVLARNPEWRSELKVLSVKSDDQFASEVVGEVQHHLGIGGNNEFPGELNRGLWNQMVSQDADGVRRLNPDAWHPQKLQEIPDEYRPNKVFGRDGKLVEDNQEGGYLNRLVQTGFQRTGSWISYMSRQDQYLREYVNMRKVMQPWEDMHTTHLVNAGWDADEAAAKSRELVIDHATEQSWYRTLKNLDHPGTRSQTAVLLRNMAPFYRAQQGFLERWGRAFRYAPSMIAKLDQAANYVPKAPLMHKDPDGQERIYIPLTGAGQWTLGKIGSALGVNLQNLPIPNAISGDLLQSSPGFNVDFLKHPLTGPVVTLPLQTIGAFTHNSTLNTLLEGAAGSNSVDNESGAGILSDALPAVVRPLAQWVMDQNNVKEVAAQQAMAYLQASGHGLPSNASPAQINAYLKQVQAHALGWTLLQALTKPFVPMPEKNEAPMPDAGQEVDGKYVTNAADQAEGLGTVKAEFNDLVKQTGSYELAYQYWAQYHPDSIPFTTGSTENNTEATIPSTEAAFSFMNGNQGILDDYKLAAPFLIPQGEGKFSFQPYALAQQLGLQTAKDNATYLSSLEANDNLQTWYDVQDNKKAELLTAGNSSAGAAAVRAKYASWEQPFLALHPDVATYISNGSVRDNERTSTIQQMYQLLKDPRTPDSPEAQTMTSFLNLWTSYQQQLLGVVSRGQGGTAQKAAITAQFDSTAKQMSNADPTASMLYNKLFRYEETTKLNAAGGL